MIRITETARDAMQGIKQMIPTSLKVSYVNELLNVGFDTVDCGSFVSPRLIPQMADSSEVIKSLKLPERMPELMVLVVNTRGVDLALQTGRINCLSYPFSVSPTFLKRNLNTDESGSLNMIREMIHATKNHPIEWVVYLSMALGNPYGDVWNPEIVMEGAAKLYDLGVRRMPLSDILGNATPTVIYDVYKQLIPAFPEADFGIHLHTKVSESYEKLEAAWEAGVRSYETVVNGQGGCPTAADEMVGNLSTQDLLAFCSKKGIVTGIDPSAISQAAALALEF
ncbi:MAG: hydroxymethylglutaryl-CoA lyase [Bacteroidetes bacterium HGW-Bacteroidetes-1]|jgi:hydroxymethylglutaryl-CoA lyase|nr:MAG: hydroxymethylglutaryl-CoA lyase [Bacteroidetes bacterium HGW-Bacteroidetes-1]